MFYNLSEILRIIRINRQRRLTRLAEEKSRREANAVELISKYKDLYELLSDAVYLGQVNSQEKAFQYVLDVRKAKTLRERINWEGQRELFRLASRQMA